MFWVQVVDYDTYITYITGITSITGTTSVTSISNIIPSNSSKEEFDKLESEEVGIRWNWNA